MLFWRTIKMNNAFRPVISWKVNTECNFKCKYCYGKTDEITKRIDIDKSISVLQKTGIDWLVRFTGGEPLLHPDFLELCKKITKYYKITIDTNLSDIRKIKLLSDVIPPDRIEYFSISLHIEERERLKKIDDFLVALNLLKSKGHRYIVGYVLHPSLIRRFEEDCDKFRSLGVDILPRPFKGEYLGKSYPAAYDKNAISILKRYDKDYIERMPFDSEHVLCSAGKNFLKIWPDGSVTRCHSDRTVLGNIGTAIKLIKTPAPCKVKVCDCFGRNYILGARSNPWKNSKNLLDFFKLHFIILFLVIS